MSQTLYEVLGVSQLASESEIKSAYRKAARMYHPDSSGDPSTRVMFDKATEARDTLLDADKRAAYDRNLGSSEQKKTADAPKSGTRSRRPRATDTTVPHDDIHVANYTFDESLLEEPKYVLARTKIFPHMGFAAAIVLVSVVALWHFSTWPLGYILGGMALGLIFAAAGLDKSNARIYPWWSPAAVTGPILALLWALSSRVPVKDHKLIWLLVGIAVVTPLFYFTRTAFKKVSEAKKVLKPRTLKKNNAFTFGEMDAFEQVMNDAIQQMWGLPATVIIGMNSPAFSHMVFVGNKVFLLKGVYLNNPGQVAASGSYIINRYNLDHFDTLLDGTYLNTIENFMIKARKMVDKDVELFPFVVAFPSENMLSFVESSVNFVKGGDIQDVMLSEVSDGHTKNVVDHMLIAELTKLGAETMAQYQLR